MDAVNPAISQYLHEVEKEMTCSPKRKKELLQRLRTDIEEFADNCGEDLDKQAIADHFGAPKDIAENFLATTDYADMKKAVSIKKTIVICTVVVCLIALISFVIYIIYDYWARENFANGYVIEVTYETVDGTPPPEPEGARIY
ncbi:MAG TPA: hypothetical protein IAA38_05625 [Candidatus Ruminococcus gallistercoris]|nr:hypothetical protein [Candidatus Ruminococcus gallistercoris]